MNAMRIAREVDDVYRRVIDRGLWSGNIDDKTFFMELDDEFNSPAEPKGAYITIVYVDENHIDGVDVGDLETDRFDRDRVINMVMELVG